MGYGQANQIDREMMTLALGQARVSLESGGVPVGAVLSAGGQLEQPSEVNNSTTTGTGSGAAVCAGEAELIPVRSVRPSDLQRDRCGG